VEHVGLYFSLGHSTVVFLATLLIACTAGALQGPLEGIRAVAGPELCRLAIGRDYTDASPIRGTHIGGAGEALSVHVAVQGPEAGADQ
jgi:hypothetical protein